MRNSLIFECHGLKQGGGYSHMVSGPEFEYQTEAFGSVF
jgi:hypothetical protein